MSTGGGAAPNSSQGANSIFAGPATGADAPPGFRAQVIADLPTGIPNANLFNIGSNDLIALQEFGSAIKAGPPGFTVPVNNSAVTLVNQTARSTLIYIPKPMTITGVKFIITVQGNYTSTGYNGLALYSLNSATGLLTQVAATTTSTTIWASAPGMITVPFATPYAANEGVYAVLNLYQRSAETTAPQLGAATMNVNLMAMDFPNSIKFGGAISTTSLASSLLFSTISSNSGMTYIYLY